MLGEMHNSVNSMIYDIVNNDWLVGPDVMAHFTGWSQEKERAVLKTSELKEPSLNVQDSQVKLEATDYLNDDVKPKKENIKPKSIKQRKLNILLVLKKVQ